MLSFRATPGHSLPVVGACRLLHRPARSSRDRGDLRARRDVWPVGAGGASSPISSASRRWPRSSMPGPCTKAPPPERPGARISRSSSGCRWQATFATSSPGVPRRRGW